MYAPNGNGDSSGTSGDPSSSLNGGNSNSGLVGLDDLSTSLNDSDLYVPQIIHSLSFSSLEIPSMIFFFSI
ncbi:unnamed protein product [Rotaria magnacalcarata]|uniref:Uncharacterized protein n=1 Tax=Rotaria magnacalcarata TaxID=392030 RepID=A0A8S2S7P2_9BILA|nr:unnamed protein product [Rotaria magnacalcarata]